MEIIFPGIGETIAFPAAGATGAGVAAGAALCGAGAVGAYIGGSIADNMSYVLLMGIYGIMALISIFPLLGIKKN